MHAFEATQVDTTEPIEAVVGYVADSAAPYTNTITTTKVGCALLVFNSSDTTDYASPFVGQHSTYIDAGTGWSLSAAASNENLPIGTYTATVNSAGSTDFVIALVAVRPQQPAASAFRVVFICT